MGAPSLGRWPWHITQFCSSKLATSQGTSPGGRLAVPVASALCPPLPAARPCVPAAPSAPVVPANGSVPTAVLALGDVLTDALGCELQALMALTLPTRTILLQNDRRTATLPTSASDGANLAIHAGGRHHPLSNQWHLSVTESAAS